MTRLSYASSFLASSKLLAKLSCSVPCLHSFTATLVWRKFCSRPWIWIRKINQSLSNTSKTCWFTRPVACKWKPCCCYRCKARIKKNVKTDSNQKWNASGKLERKRILHNQILKISRRYQGVMGKWKNKLRGNTWDKKNIEVLCHTENRCNWKLRISRLENCYTEQELVILLLLQPFTPLHQNAHSPNYSQYISWSADKENLFNNQELL